MSGKGGSEQKIWQDIEKVLAWPIDALKTKNAVAGGVALVAMYYVAGGWPGSAPCEAMVKGYMVGGLAYFGVNAVSGSN
jgi:aromatic ring-opening dioxygenase catalytic subunit (LigB family)